MGCSCSAMLFIPRRVLRPALWPQPATTSDARSRHYGIWSRLLALCGHRDDNCETWWGSRTATRTAPQPYWCRAFSRIALATSTLFARPPGQFNCPWGQYLFYQIRGCDFTDQLEFL